MPAAKGNITPLPMKNPTRMTFWVDRETAFRLKDEAKEQRLKVPDYLVRLVLAGRKAAK